MCGIDCAKQSVGLARSPKSDFGVVGCVGVGRKKILFVIRFAIVQSLAHNAVSSAKHGARGATGFSHAAAQRLRACTFAVIG
jgi:hypothetical protein